MSSKKIIHCKFCDKLCDDEAQYADHIEKKHFDMIIPGMVPRQFVYYLRTGRTHGSCVICKSPTEWNDKTNKYHRFCKNPKCKEKYRETSRMYTNVSIFMQQDHSTTQPSSTTSSKFLLIVSVAPLIYLISLPMTAFLPL